MANDNEAPFYEEEHGPPPGAPPATTKTALVEWTWLRDCGETFLSTAPPARRWLLKRGDEGVLPLGKVGMIAGAGAAGKTMALAQLALAITGGADVKESGAPGKWLDTFTVDEHGHVLLALGEEDLEEMQRRLFNAARMMRLDGHALARARKRLALLPLAGESVAFLRNDASRNLEPTDAYRLLRERLDGAGVEWRAIILDPLSRFAGADAEKDNAAATRFVETLETLSKVKGNPTVLVAHHTSQNARKEGSTDATGARGVTALTDGVRWVAGLERGPLKSSARLTSWKTNYSQGWEDVWLVRDSENGGALRPERSDEKTKRVTAQEEKPKTAGRAAPSQTPAEPEKKFSV